MNKTSSNPSIFQWHLPKLSYFSFSLFFLVKLSRMQYLATSFHRAGEKKFVFYKLKSLINCEKEDNINIFGKIRETDILPM